MTRDALILDLTLGLVRSVLTALRTIPREDMAPRVACVLDTTERALLRAVDEIAAVRMGCAA